jgi:alkyldihydroxyacetonephosphate synthase
LAEAEAWLGPRGHTLGLVDWGQASGLSINEWIGLGLPGIPDHYQDPVGVRLSGFSAVLANGARFELRVAPRRAVGPDLAALFVGMRGAFGQITYATLAAPRLDAGPVTSLPWSGERNPALEPSETAAIERLRAKLEA